jgi:hypothetical protein
MSHPLDGCFERIKRARTHLETLKDNVRSGDLEPDDEGRIARPRLDLERNELHVVATVDGELPPRVGVIVGDVIHNLHASLDNLVYELGGRQGTRDSRTCFPILEHANQWFSEQTRDALLYVSPQDRTRIESHQPFMERNGVKASKQVLSRIRRYSNESKHRVVPVVGSVLVGATVDDLDCYDFELVSAEIEVSTAKALRKNAILGRYEIRVTGSKPGVRMKGAIHWHPAIDGEPANQFLRGAHAYVHDLMIEFADARFGGPPDWFVAESQT